jgi:uncharacterized membrane protein
VATALPVPGSWHNHAALVYALGITVFCALTYRTLSRPRREEMQAFARKWDSPSWGPVVYAGILALISLSTLVYLLRTVIHLSSGIKSLHLAVSIFAVLVTWVTLHTRFAVRYAALYYAPLRGQPERPAGGLSFPEPDLTPDYWDFLYYSFTIGMCYQTSDISVESPEMRRSTLLHAIFSFLYAAGILSLLVSAVAGAL